MNVMERMAQAIVVPVIVMDDAKDAVPCADALAAGGIDVMEITLRTPAALDAIKAVAEQRPGILVGAGTVINLDQCKRAIEMGARFIVSPGFSHEVVGYCVENGITVLPGCVTPTEIMYALSYGLDTVKFFPANIYGGLVAMKHLCAPFSGLKFVPTGGVNNNNILEFAEAPYVHAVGGSWVCPKAEINAGNWEKITNLCIEARKAARGE